MRIISMHVLKWNQQNSFFIASAYDLSFVSWYQRPFFKETVNFGARTSSNRSKPGERLALNLPDAKAKCYLRVTNDQIAFTLLADDQYPQRVAFLILQKMKNEFMSDYKPDQFSKIEKDANITWQKLQNFIKKFQDPKEVDKLQKLKEELKEVEQIVHKNLDDLLKRGQDIDILMKKSKDVSDLSLDFYKNAKKANSRCCSLY